jgi:hypothetical protein
MTSYRMGESGSGKWLAAASGFLAASLYVAAMAVAGPVSGTQTNAAPAQSLACPADRIMNRVELVFGTAKASGGIVSDDDWNGFLESEVTPRFPDGLTVLRALGQWRNATGKIEKEASRILVILHRPAENADRRIESIRAIFKTRFEQESVMRIDAASCVSF